MSELCFTFVVSVVLSLHLLHFSSNEIITTFISHLSLSLYINRMLVPGKMQHVICTGNIGSEQYEDIRELAPNVHVVAGDYDVDSSFPETRVVQVGEFRIGVIHGHQVIPWGNQDALARWRRKLHVDVLISGHTHQNEIIQYDGHYHINPVRMVNVYFWRLLFGLSCCNISCASLVFCL